MTYIVFTLWFLDPWPDGVFGVGFCEVNDGLANVTDVLLKATASEAICEAEVVEPLIKRDKKHYGSTLRPSMASACSSFDNSSDVPVIAHEGLEEPKNSLQNNKS